MIESITITQQLKWYASEIKSQLIYKLIKHGTLTFINLTTDTI